MGAPVRGRTGSGGAQEKWERAHHIETFGVGESGHVFTSPEGCPLAYSNFYRRVWVPAVRAAELAPFTPHGLRHTAVALAIATGAHPKQIQELCRHRSITTTLNEYGGLFESLHEGLANSLEATILASRAGQMRDEGRTGVLELRR
jgi:integrase